MKSKRFTLGTLLAAVFASLILALAGCDYDEDHGRDYRDGHEWHDRHDGHREGEWR